MIVSASYDVVEASADYSIHDGDVVYAVDGGPVGPAGPGVPTGGSTGDVATKASNTDFDIVWQTPAPVDRITSGGNELVIDADTITGGITTPDGGYGAFFLDPGHDGSAAIVISEQSGICLFGIQSSVNSRDLFVVAGDGFILLRGDGGGDSVNLVVSAADAGISLEINGEARGLIVGSVGDNPSAPDGSLLLDEVVGPHWRKNGAWLPIGARQSPDGTWWDITVDNSGNVSAVAL